jgi:UDP-N-acetylmuramoyl-tripeptide--D-alanyl-D-alanine ligase
MTDKSFFFKKFPESQISIDTRTLRPGDLFIALQGENFKGDNFAQEALAKGACGVVCGPQGPRGPGILMVEDTLAYLTQQAALARQKFQGTVIAVTGSVGKTTVKEGLRHMLQALLGPRAVHASIKSFNNHIGLPLTLANLPETTPFGLFEVGTNHPGEIESLVGLLKPHLAILTQVSLAHAGHFGTLGAIAMEKSAIFTQANQGILSRDLSCYDQVKAWGHERGCKQWLTFGRHPASDIRLLIVEKNLDGEACEVTTAFPGGIVRYTLSCPWDHWIENSLVFLAGAYALGKDMVRAAESLATFFPVQGRGKVLTFPERDVTVVDESYNAAPQAMAACLSAFAERKISFAGRKILVLGEMRELGDNSLSEHEKLVPLICQVKAGHIFLCGQAFRGAYEHLKQDFPVTWGIDLEEIKQGFLQVLQPKDTIFLKGSNGMALWRALDWLRSENGM